MSLTPALRQLVCLSKACIQNAPIGKDFLSLCLCCLWLFPFHKTRVSTCPSQWYLFFKSVSYFSISPLPYLTCIRWGTMLGCSCPALITAPQKALERHLTAPDKWRFSRTQHSTEILNFLSHFQMLAFYDYCNMNISETCLTPWALYTVNGNKGYWLK